MKISIVIPTRERCAYLRYSIQTALEIDDPEIEIVVSDNASSDGTKELMEEFDDPRLVYVNTGARMSMRENFNTAFQATTGEYLIYFGDDDGILPGQFKFLRALLERHKPDGVSWNRATYGWPIVGYGKKTGGIRVTKDRVYGGAQAYEGINNRENLLACRLTKMTKLPEIYHGCLSRDYMVRTATSPDMVFDGAIPDYVIAYRAILKGGHFLHVDHTFSINGYSPASTGGGHNAGTSKTGDDSTSKTFGMENKADPLADVIGHASSVPLAFFSTLETIRSRHHLQEFKPDYLAWYLYVLGSSRKNPDLNAQLLKVLSPHAEATGSVGELEQAKNQPLQRNSAWGERLAKWSSYLRSVRVSTQIGGENTILTAVHTLDDILGNDLGAVHSGKMSAGVAWAAAKRRSKKFDRQL